MRRIARLSSLCAALLGCSKEPAPSATPPAPPPNAHDAALVDAAPAVVDAAAPDAAPALLTLERVPYASRAALAYRGGVDDAWRFFDRNGENQVTVATSKVTGPETEMGLRQTWRVRLDHMVIEAGKPRTLRTIRDAVVDCDFQISLELQGLELGDVDGDGIGEIVFGYELGCRSDASSSTLKVMLLENGKKHVLRGWTRVHTQGDSTLGGDVVPDADSEAIPRALRGRLDAFWDQVVDDDYLSGDATTEEPPEP